MKPKKTKFPSELRFDLASKDWVLIATGRAKRPETFKKEKREKEELTPSQCPFCNLKNQTRPTLIFSKGKKISFEDSEKPRTRTPHENKLHRGQASSVGGEIPDDWTTIVLPNKFPAVIPSPKLNEKEEGKLYKTINAAGFHEVVVTRDHTRQLAQFSVKEIKELIEAYQERYQKLAKEKFVNYVSIFHNQGKEAGASISHPHSQIITTPLIDADLKEALVNAEFFFKRNGRCLYCSMNDWERKVKKRLVFENKNFLVLCPFASKAAFEIIISPKKHLPYFERITKEEKLDLSEAFRVGLAKLYKGLSDPAYNFYLHTAPCDGKKYPFYHWHWTILPKTAIPAGFEIGTRIEISTIEPEKAAEYLRKQ
ncbi:MAG: DUF4921 family protein [Patescibacteria group bacterium]|nr:DUF4921 family protein [Patescibacteria group bacterium]